MLCWSMYVARHPAYVGGLLRLGEVRWVGGGFADAAMYLERTLKLDPTVELARRLLIQAYGSSVIWAQRAKWPTSRPTLCRSSACSLLMHDGDWHQAAQVFLASLTDGTAMDIYRSLGRNRATHGCAQDRRLPSGARRPGEDVRSDLERQWNSYPAHATGRRLGRRRAGRPADFERRTRTGGAAAARRPRGHELCRP